MRHLAGHQPPATNNQEPTTSPRPATIHLCNSPPSTGSSSPSTSSSTSPSASTTNRAPEKTSTNFSSPAATSPGGSPGTSMVATTFAADTPLAVTGMVAMGGIAGNWLWWNFIASGMLTVFFYARLWRRSGVMTDIEFSEIRYSGRPAAFLRGFRALYLGIPINCIILGWVNLAMVKILQLVLGVTKPQALAIVIGMIALTSFISTLSGLWGVLVTDLFQFVIKMGMVTVLAVFAVRAVGGIDSMKAKLALVDHARGAVQGLRPQLRPRPPLRLDADDHVPGLHLNELVVHLVSRRRARRRRLRRAAHVQREGRKEFAARDALVQHRALRRASVAVGAGRARVADSFPRPRRSRNRLHPRDDRLPSALIAWTHDRRLRRRLHVHHRDAAQLGRQLPGQRFLPPLLKEDRNRASLCNGIAVGHRASHHRLGRRDVLSRLHRRRMEAPARHRRGHRRRPPAALVLVAHQRLERSLGHDLGLRRFARACKPPSASTKISRAISPGS